MRKVLCDYCKTPAEFIDSEEIYCGISYGMIYYCRKCKAYVGVHKNTDIPLGRLANKELREWKVKAHLAFDPIWQSHSKSRTHAYQWLSAQMGIPFLKTHIGMFDVDQCKQVVEVSNKYMKKRRSKDENIAR